MILRSMSSNKICNICNKGRKNFTKIQMDKYDVFISCKSEDYRYAEVVYDFLTKNHIHTFLASKELRKLGDSEYREAIEEALETAEHLIVLSSKPEYIKSKWVKYEWGLFLNDKIDGHKSGNILTILIGFEPSALGIALRKYESFSFESFKDSLLSYVETNESKARVIEIQNQHRRDEEQRRVEEEAKRRRQLIRNELLKLAEEYKQKESNLAIDIAKIRSMLKSLGITNKKCPICSIEIKLEKYCCDNCGWVFSPLDGIDNADYLFDNNHNAALIYRSIYEKSKCSNSSNHEIALKNLRAEQEAKDVQIIELKNKIRNLIQELERKDNDINHLRKNLENHSSQLIFPEKRPFENAVPSGELGYVTTMPNKPNKPNKKTQRKNGRYAVIITFCPKDAADIVKEYNSTFELHRNNDGTYKYKVNTEIANFDNLQEAHNLKRELEGKGATVIIQNNGQNVIVKSPTTSSSERVRKDTARPVVSYRMNAQSTALNYGVRIKHCGINKAKVVQILSEVYKKSVNSFKQSLDNLPFETPSILSRNDAADLLIKLGQIGATVDIYHT